MVDNRRDISFTGIYADANFSDWNGLDAMLRYYRKRVLCQDCRKRLSRLSVKSRGHPYVYYSCSSHRHNSRVCSPHSIREEKLLSELIRILSEIAQRDDVHELEKHETVFVVDAIGSVRFEIL